MIEVLLPKLDIHRPLGVKFVRVHFPCLSCLGKLPKLGCWNSGGERVLSWGVLGSAWRASWGRLGVLGRSWERIRNPKDQQGTRKKTFTGHVPRKSFLGHSFGALGALLGERSVVSIFGRPSWEAKWNPKFLKIDVKKQHVFRHVFQIIVFIIFN